MAIPIQLERKLVVLLAMLALLTAAAFVTVRPVKATAGDCYYSAGVVVVPGNPEILIGTKGNDWINCSGSDVPVEIRGGFGDDELWGSQYADIIRGGWGDDDLYGNGGDDWLFGGQDDDYMDGGADYDNCLGGRGSDSFGISTGGCEVADPGREP